MKVLFLTNQLDMGGIETNLVRLTGAFSARGHNVLAATSPGSLVGKFEDAGGRHFAVDLTSPTAPHSEIVTLKGIIDAEAPDVIHVMSASAAVALRRALGVRRRRPPIVSSIMGLFNSPNESRLTVALRAWMTTLGADRVILIAPSFEDFARWAPVRRRRTISGVVVGVDESDVTPTDAKSIERTRAEFRVPAGVPLVVTIGALELRKSHELLIRAAVKVLEREPDTRFLIIGEGRLRPQLQRQIDRLELADRLSLVGERLDADRILAASDVCVRPGVVEGFVGITVLEAQMQGVPVVAFETRDVRMAIEDGQTGLLAGNGDPNDLARAVLRLLNDPAEARLIGSAGRRAVMERFEIGAVAQWLEAQYQDLVDSRCKRM